MFDAKEVLKKTLAEVNLFQNPQLQVTFFLNDLKSNK